MRDLHGDHMHDESGATGASGSALPAWAREWLSAKAESRPIARAAIMERVRALPAPQRAASRLSPSMRRTRWSRRGLLTPFGATAMAGVLGLLLCVRSLTSLGAAGAPATGVTTAVWVIGDTVVPSLGLRGTIRDTLRIVTFALRGEGVRSAAVVGDFNAWRNDSTRLVRQADGSWTARVIVPRDAVRYDFVVNDEPLRGAAAPPASAESTRTLRTLRTLPTI